MKKLLLIGIVIILIFSCSSTKTTKSTASFVVPEDQKNEEEKKQEQIESKPPTSEVKKPANYRIQILATKSYQTALEEKEKAQKLNAGNVYIEEIDGYWKVRIGDYSDRTEAMRGKNFISSIGWKDAWIVDLTNKEPKTELEVQGKVFQIQMLASNDRTEAEEFRKNLKILGIDPSYLVQENGVWKVRTGNFTNRIKAEQEMKRLREMGFEDSWIYAK